ncbi:IclR family transcriptional regulator [Nesterenkonia sp. NBAIMH1]|uniref:IclR family transcriptional regulator n=1 Tax=Nesterenkonia sp. NBAIMH1 TaxID=2600320 RepID=UPI0011B718A2|nr:IclR family transcriptional regulator [Nesterenkonia sp. NBAIMH1]
MTAHEALGQRDKEDDLSGEESVPAGTPRSVVDRALIVLGTFQNRRERQTLSEISRRANLPIATCYRIVQQFTAWGALEKGADGRYSVGLRLWEVASFAPRPTSLQYIARPHIEELFKTTGFAAHLAIRQGLELVTIERFHPGRRPERGPTVGGRSPMHASAIGQVLLAYAPITVREQILSAGLKRFTSRTPSTRAELEAVLDHVVRVGYAISDGQVIETVCSVAVPLMGYRDTPVGAISLAFEDRNVVETTQVDKLRIAAARLSKALREVRYEGLTE